MMIKVEKTKTISGHVMPPSSKSHTVRALLIATMAGGASRILNALDSEDTLCARRVCTALGATITELQHSRSSGINLEVVSAGIPFFSGLSRRGRDPAVAVTSPTRNDDAMVTLFTGDSGITTRFVIPMLGLRTNNAIPISIDCGLQMRARPITPLVHALRSLGMGIPSEQWPLSVTGSLQGGQALVDGVTSQYCSALLLSLPCAPQDSVITVEHLNERPYVQMTTRWLDEQNIRYEWIAQGDRDEFRIPGGQHYTAFEKQIPGDFSSASYLIAAAVLCGGSVKFQGLDMDDPQGDKRLIPILQEMGAKIEVHADEIVIHGGRPLTGFTIDCNDIPDLIPTLAVIATQARATTRLTNVAQARLKETDRIHSMAVELSKMGATIHEEKDGLVIKDSPLAAAELHGYNDHRTIMALAVAGLVARGATIIDTAEGINKTFPGFVAIMQSLGAQIAIV